MANDIVVPQKGLLDYLSRNDDLLLQLLDTNRAMARGLGSLTPPSAIPVSQTSPIELRKRLENASMVPYDTYNVADMASAVTDLLVEKEGDYLQAWTNGVYAGIGVRFNNIKNPIIYFDRHNPIKRLPFWKLFLTYPAQSGRVLDLFIGRQGLAETDSPSNIVTAVQPFYTLRTDKDSHFTGAIAQNATEEENLTGLNTNKVRITSVAIQSDQQLDYRVILFNSDTFADTDLDADRYFADVELDLPSYGFRIAGAGQYYMVVNGLSIDYEDLDASKELHVALQNLSATGKNAGATGEVVVLFGYEERG